MQSLCFQPHYSQMINTPPLKSLAIERFKELRYF